MIAVETSNRSGTEVAERDATDLARCVLASEASPKVSSESRSCPPPRSARWLEHLGIDEATDVLAFPLDARDALPDGVPRALGDVVLCPEVVGEEWRGPLVHGLLHLLGYEHGEEMERREREHAAG